jgi:methylmalonic aciduria homocystinuria type C protein
MLAADAMGTRNTEDAGQVVRLLEDLKHAGFDLLHHFSVRSANRHLDPEHRLAAFEREDCSGIVVGNTRRSWPRLQQHLEQWRARGYPTEDPLDRYVVAQITGALASLGDGKSGLKHVVSFSHIMVPRPIPIQRIADAAGLAHLGPAHLSVHHRFGPWFALRAVITLDIAPPEDTPMGPAATICKGCSRPCQTALIRAMAGAAMTEPNPSDVSVDQAPWLAIRDACPIGAEYRYTAGQLRYHYDKSVDEPPSQGPIFVVPATSG